LNLLTIELNVLQTKWQQKFGVDHNLITLLQGKGLSLQSAIDSISDLLNDCYKRWYSALANMPIWGEETDRQVLKFVDCCRNVALGNLYWRYVTSNGEDKGSLEQ
jgi:hypothetical protein